MTNSRVLARMAATAIAWVAGAGIAAAVTASGAPVRVDVDPGTAWYGFFSYQVVATKSGGFGVAWNEDTKEDPPFFPANEGVKARLFRSNFAPIAAPRAPDSSGRLTPSLTNLIQIGTDKLFLVYSVGHKITSKVTRREFSGQTIAVANEALGARQLLNNTVNDGASVSRSAGLFDGRGVFGWYDGLVSSSTPSIIKGRFVSTAGAPLPASVNLTLSAGFALMDLKPVGTGFVALYKRVDGATTQVRARVFKANGAPLGAAKAVATGASSLPLLATFPDGRILVATWIASGSQVNLVGQLYTQTWTKIGTAKTLIAAGAANDRVDIAALTDGGIVVARTYGSLPTYRHTVRRFDKSLKPIGALYTVASVGLDFARIAVLSEPRRCSSSSRIPADVHVSSRKH